MLILAPMLLLLASPAVMLLIRLVRPRFAYFWLVAAAGVIPAWLITAWLRGSVPAQALLVSWEPISFFPDSPALLLDVISWPFALALMAITAAAILTDVSRAGDADWKAWSSIQALAALGLLAVMSANPLTLLLAWTALDGVELVILLAAVRESAARERVIAGFTARAAGLLVLLWASMVSIHAGENLNFETIGPNISPYLLLAAGLRLGVIPLHQPFLEHMRIRRSMGALLRLAPAAASLTLLVRTSFAGASADLAPILYFMSALAGLYAAISWASVRDEAAGQPFWILGAASFAVGAAVIVRPEASLAWGISGLLSGAVLFLFSARHRALSLLPILGLLFFTTLPYTPSWAGVNVYTRAHPAAGVLFTAAHALLLAGYARHTLRPGMNLTGMERWVWAIYPLGLALLPLSHALLAYAGPAPEGIEPGAPSLLASWPAGVVILLAAGAVALFRRGLSFPPAVLSTVQSVLSFHWLYRALWGLFRLAGRAVGLLNTILEGEGGILWTMLLLTLLLAAVIQAGQGGP